MSCVARKDEAYGCMPRVVTRPADGRCRESVFVQVDGRMRDLPTSIAGRVVGPYRTDRVEGSAGVRVAITRERPCRPGDLGSVAGPQCLISSTNPPHRTRVRYAEGILPEAGQPFGSILGNLSP